MNGPLPKRCRSKLEYWRGSGGWVGEATVVVSPKNHNRILLVKTDHTLQGSNPYPLTLVTGPLAQNPPTLTKTEPLVTGPLAKNPPTLTKTEPLDAASCRNCLRQLLQMEMDQNIWQDGPTSTPRVAMLWTLDSSTAEGDQQRPGGDDGCRGRKRTSCGAGAC